MAHIFLYFLALLSLSTSPNWAKLNHMPPEVLGLYRMLGATALLSFFLLARKKWPKFKLNTATYWAIGSALFFFLHLWTYKYSAKHTLVANTMILFATNPIWASLGGLVFFNESIKPRIVFSYLLATIGVFILVAKNLELTSSNHNGNVAALISAFFYAGYMITSKKARIEQENTHYALIQYGFTALFFALTSWATHAPLTSYDNISWIAIVGLIVFPTFLGHYLFTYLVKNMNLGFMTCGKLIEPVLAAIMAYYLFNEQLGNESIFAFALTGSAVVILFWPSLASFFSKRQKT